MIKNVLSEKRRGEKHCKMKFRIVKNAVTNRFGEGFSLLGNKGAVGVPMALVASCVMQYRTSAKLCHAVWN